MTSFQSETFSKRYNHSLVIKHVRTQDSLLVGLAAASPFQSLSSCDQSPALFFFLLFPQTNTFDFIRRMRNNAT